MLSYLGILAVVALGLAGLGLLLDRLFALPTAADEVHAAPTDDGWSLALHRYRPRDTAAGREPVLLCHGLLSNRFSLDLDDGLSLARRLRDEGFDVWIMELRARGGSRRDPLRPAARSLARLGFDWTLDEFARRDLPAAVRRVLALTGAPRLLYVGHSLGGMILYAEAAAGSVEWCRAAVTIDSPVHFAPLRQPTWPARVYARLVPFVPVVMFKPIAAVLYLLLPGALLRRIVRLDKRTLFKILFNGLVRIGSSRVMLHLARVIAEGRFRSFDGKVDYEEGPGKIAFPLMVLRAPAGRSPEACVKHAYDRSPAREKAYVRCGRAEGFSMDHDHFTLVIGAEAPKEIYPVIAGWLKRHASA